MVLFILTVVALIALSAAGNPVWLLLSVLAVVLVPTQEVELGGMRLALDDIATVALLLTAVRHYGFFQRGFRNVPHLKLWLAFGVLVSIAYLAAPVNAQYVTDPARVVYQLFRYCWKPILFYPFAVILLSGHERGRDMAIYAIVVVAGLCSIEAAVQGYGQEFATGPFQGRNVLGGALVAPLILSVAGCTSATSRRQFWFFLASSALIARGLLFTSSRGAFVAVCAGMAMFGVFLLSSSVGRRRLSHLAAIGCLAIVLAFALKPDLLQRPNVAQLFTAMRGTSDENFQWRLTERWPFFWEKVTTHPWLGVGVDQDFTISERDQGNTPHNGYLSLALIHGIPAGVVFLLFGILAIRNGIRVARRTPVVKYRFQALAVAAALAGLFVHNIVESTLVAPFVNKLFWFLVAIGSKQWATGVAQVRAAVPTRPIRRLLPRRTYAVRPMVR